MSRSIRDLVKEMQAVFESQNGIYAGGFLSLSNVNHNGPTPAYDYMNSGNCQNGSGGCGGMTNGGACENMSGCKNGPDNANMIVV